MYGAAEKSRTSTGFLPLGPQPSASAIPPRPQIFFETSYIVQLPSVFVNENLKVRFGHPEIGWGTWIRTRA